MAEKQAVLPLLHETLRAIQDGVPTDQAVALKQSQQSNLVKSLLISRELIRIVERFSAEAIDVLPYKGAALAELLYGDIALRQSGDIDLLIRAKDFSRARSAVIELGFTPQLTLSEAEQRAYLKSGYECAFDSPAGKNLLEIQWAIQPRFYAVNFDMEGIFQRAVTMSVAGQLMRTLSPEDLFLILCAHAAKHVWGRLVWISDLGQLMARPRMNWDWITTQAAQLGIVRIVRVSMILANRLLNAPIPPSALKGQPEDPVASVMALGIERELLSGAESDVESLSYFRRMMRLRERRLDRLRFARRLIFSPGPNEWNAVRLPTLLFPLYRIVRLYRLFARLIRR